MELLVNGHRVGSFPCALLPLSSQAGGNELGKLRTAQDWMVTEDYSQTEVNKELPSQSEGLALQSVMLKWSGEREDPCLLPDLSRKAHY